MIKKSKKNNHDKIPPELKAFIKRIQSHYYISYDINKYTVPRVYARHIAKHFKSLDIWILLIHDPSITDTIIIVPGQHLGISSAARNALLQLKKFYCT